MAKWGYQLNPHDLWDYDEINENILLNLQINGQQRKVLVHIARNGYMYVLDRATGQPVSITPYDLVNATLGIDPQTGRPIPNEDLHPALGKTIVNICPAAPGAKDWQPSAYSPRTRLLYVPHQHLCMNWRSSEVGYIAGTPYVGATVDMFGTPGDNYAGEFMAWDLVQKKKVWTIREKFPVWSGTLVTGGDVAFYGTMDRWFKAVDAMTGQVLWQFRAPSGIIGQPVTFSADGTQYVAILSGIGGWPGVIANAEVDPRVRNGALGFVGATQDLPLYTAGGSTLLVFALPSPPGSPPQRSAAAEPPPAKPGEGQHSQ
jgi:lanthanide-dependent methanol dehydrogenase